MLTGFLLRRLERAQTAHGVRLAVRALELTTGYRTQDLQEYKEIVGTFDTQYNSSGWPQDYNGFYRLRSIGGSTSYTGRTVTFESALEVPALYGGVKIIAEDMGTLPNFVYRRGPNRTVTKDFAHPLYRVLHDLPSPDISAGEFCEMLTAHALLCGNGYARIDRSAGRLYLWPLMPDTVRIEKNQRGASFYIVRDGSGPEQTFSQDRIFHLRGLMLSGMYGDNLLKTARQAIGLGMAGQEYAARFFADDATPGIILKRPAGAPPLVPGQVEAVKEAWIKRFRGKPHEPAILQDGTEPMRLDPDHQKLQMLESRKYQVIEACRYLRLSPYKLADHDRATFSNIEELGREHVSQTIGPWVRRWRQATYRCLLTEDERLADSLYAEHSVEAFLQGRFDQQSEGYRKLLEKGVFSINEVRRLMNLNPTEGGDAHFIQLNMATVQDVASGATLPDSEPSSRLLPASGVD